MRRASVALFFLCFAVGAIRGEAENVRFQRISLEEGLSQSSAYGIVEDRRGYLWIGTLDGLNRWDGNRFRVFRPRGTPGLCDSHVPSLHVGSDGELWIGTYAGGLSRYDPQRDEFRCFWPDSPTKRQILELVGYGDALALAVPGDGVLRFDPKTETFTQIDRNSISNPSSLLSLSTDDGVVLWVGTFGEGLFRIETDGEVRQIEPSAFSDGDITALALEPSGEALWIANDPHGVLRYDLRPDADDPISTPVPPNSLSSTLMDLLFDGDGKLWIGTQQGLGVLDPRTSALDVYRHDPLRPESLSFDGVVSFYTAPDRPDLIWIGTAGGGLNLFDRSRAVFGQIDHHPSAPIRIGNAQVRSIVIDHAEELWIGTMDGLNRIDAERASTQNFNLDTGSAAATVWSLHEDRAGELWIGGRFGLDRLNRARDLRTAYRNDPDDPNSLTFDNVRSIAETADGTIWAASTLGLNRFDRESESFTRFQHDPDDPDSLGHNTLRFLHVDREDRLWIAFFGGGVDRLDDFDDPRFVHFRHDPDNPHSLSHDRVISLYQDSRGHLWVGTDDGLDRFDEAEFFVRSSEGLPNRVVYAINEDLSGDLWISTNAGLTRLRVEPDGAITDVRTWDGRDGLQGNEFNSNAFFRADSGELYFGGINGLNFFDPKKLGFDDRPPPVELDEFRIGERRIYLARSPEEIPLVRLPYDVADFSFEIAALSFRQPEKSRYRYQLEGFDPYPLEVDAQRRLVRYTNVPPGDYVFRATASNSDGVWNPEGASVRVVVIPPWWERAWARTLFAVSIIGLLALLQSRYKRRLIEQAENQRRVRELEGARQLQIDLLPLEVPKLNDWDIAAIMETAAEVGGDYYDFRLDHGVLTVAVGDATGHGLRSGTLVAVLKGLFCAEAYERTLLSFFRLATDTFREMRLRKLHMALALLRIDGPRIVAASAGMPPILLWRAASGEVEEILFKGAPLGAFPGFPYEDQRFEMSEDDTLLIASDGLFELREADGRLFGDELPEVFAQTCREGLDARGIVERLPEIARRRLGDASLEDDLTCVVLRRRPAILAESSSPEPGSES